MMSLFKLIQLNGFIGHQATWSYSVEAAACTAISLTDSSATPG